MNGPSLTVPVVSTDNAMYAGLRQEWITAEDGDVKAVLTSGAGLGSPYLVLSVRVDGDTFYETIDVTSFLPEWIKSAIARRAAVGP